MSEAALQEVERKVQAIQRSRIEQAEFKYVTWGATAFPGTVPEDLTDPAYWANVAENFHPFDEIRVIADDGAWMAELIVTDCGRNYAKTVMMFKMDLDSKSIAAEIPVGYRVEWKGPHNKWAVIRDSDSAMVHKESASKSQAYAWLNEHLKVVR